MGVFKLNRIHGMMNPSRRLARAFGIETVKGAGVVVPTALAPRRGRIVMLHPWAENAQTFFQHTEVLTRKMNQAGYDCIFLQGPHALPATSKLTSGDGHRLHVRHTTGEKGRAWFLYDSLNPGDATKNQDAVQIANLVGIDESLCMLQTELGRAPHSGNIPGSLDLCALLGFSQGAVLTHIVSILAQRTPQYSELDAVILASGLPVAASDGDAPIQLPSLHIIGKKDSMVNPSQSLDLASRFESSQIVWHEKGHILSQSPAVCSAIIHFLEACRQKKSVDL